MVDFEFYQTAYQGNDIPDESTFRPLRERAERTLRRYEAIYTVRAPQKCAKAMAVCAMADALYRFTEDQGGKVSSATVDNVSTSYKVPDVDLSAKAQSRELYRCACLYLDISRGCGR